MNLAVKAIAGTGFAGSVSVGGYAAYSHFLSKSINIVKDRLINEKFKILPLKVGRENNDGWSVILEEYKKKGVTDTSKFSFSIDASSDDVNIEKLKTACLKVLGERDSDSFYLKAKRWCVVARSLSERLEDKGFRVLNNTANDNSDDSFWITKEATYKDGNLDGIEGDLQTAAGDKGKRKEAIKKGCKNLLEGDVKTFSDGFDAKYSKSEKFCAVKK